MSIKIAEYQQRTLPLDDGPSKWWGECSICYDSTIIDAPFPEGFCFKCHESGYIQHSIGKGRYLEEERTRHVLDLVAQGYLEADPKTWWQGFKLERESYAW